MNQINPLKEIKFHLGFFKLSVILFFLLFTNTFCQAQKKIFLAVEMDQTVINDYYPKNAKNPDFDHFVFQQVIEDGTKKADTITLIAYAIDKNGKTIGNYLTLKSLPTDSYQAPKRIHFANIIVKIRDLDVIFPSGVKSSLKLFPILSHYPHHIAYKFVCESCFTNLTIDPSPPAPSQ